MLEQTDIAVHHECIIIEESDYCIIFIFQAGLVISIGMFVVAYFVVGITVLSISAIATNGAVKEGGAYCILLSNKRNIRSFT